MKTWIKVLIVIILMACASGATCFVFYKNLENDKNFDYKITSYLTSSERTIFNDELQAAKSNCNDSRMNLLCDTLYNIEEILEEHNYYLINKNSKIENKREIKKQFANIKDRKNQLYSMLVEYNIKCKNSDSFDKEVGTNDLYESFANFFKEYSTFIEFVNSKVSKVVESANADIKFSVIELYTLVVRDSFSIVIKENGLKTIVDTSNIDYMNDIIEFENGQLSTNLAYFSSASTNFIINYNVSNKKSFAKELYKNVQSISGNVNDMTTNELASYYFKEIFGV